MQKYLFVILYLLCTPAHSYSDQIFKELLRQSIDFNPSVKSARNQVEAAAHEMDTSRWSYYPVPSVSYERSDQLTPGMLNKNTKYFRLQQPIWTAGRLDAQHQKALVNLEISEATLEEQRIQSAFKFLQILIEYKNAEDKIQIHKHSENNLNIYLNKISRRIDMGFAPRADLQLVLSRLNYIKSQILQNSYTKKLAKSKLEQMLGTSSSFEHILNHELIWDVASNDVFSWNEIFNASKMDEIISVNPTTRRAMGSINLALQDVKILKSKNIPEVYIRGEIRHGDSTGTDRSIFIGLNSNFGPGLSSYSAISSAQSKVDAVKNEAQTKKIEIREQIEVDIHKIYSNIAQLNELEQNLSNIKKYSESTERQYLSGRRTWQELLNNAREEVQIQSQIADTKSQIWLADRKLKIYLYGLDLYLSDSTLK